ncbi:hypothetical protein N431DRAFT_119901 [Stipitochalara longipes BDJ]|nr:hypothetical protein N431DRAFT_119901 [Stipitochalara longipes BDJ]
MDTISKNYRSQETRLKCLEEDLQKTTERNKLKIYGLHEDCILHDKHIKSLEGEQKTQSEILTKLEETFAKVETKLATLEKSVSKEISNSRIDRQCQSLNVSAGNPVSYDKLKARCRKLEERFTSLQQSTTTEERKHRLLEGNTKYTRQLNESVNSWKAQCDKEHSEAKLLKEQMQTLEKRSSAMEKTIRDQQRLIEELVSQLPRHSDKSRVSETPPKRFWQR